MTRALASSPPPSDQQNASHSQWGMPKGDNSRLWLGLGAVAVVGGAYYYYTQPDDAKGAEANKKRN